MSQMIHRRMSKFVPEHVAYSRSRRGRRRRHDNVRYALPTYLRNLEVSERILLAAKFRPIVSKRWSRCWKYLVRNSPRWDRLDAAMLR